MWVFNNNPRVSKGCEVLKVGCLKHHYRGVPGVWVLDIKICGGHYLELRSILLSSKLFHRSMYNYHNHHCQLEMCIQLIVVNTFNSLLFFP